MKKLIFLLLSIIPAFSFAQTNYATMQEAREALKDGYKLPSGWVIKEGDKLQIGKGSTGDRKFAYIFEGPGITLNTARTPLPNAWANKLATVKKITINGQKKVGFTPVIVIGVGLLTNYHVEIDNAIDAAEIIPPAEYSKKNVEATGTQPASLADELKKLKDLLDSGAITKEEYEAMKKKLIQ